MHPNNNNNVHERNQPHNLNNNDQQSPGQSNNANESFMTQTVASSVGNYVMSISYYQIFSSDQL